MKATVASPEMVAYWERLPDTIQPRFDKRLESLLSPDPEFDGLREVVADAVSAMVTDEWTNCYELNRAAAALTEYRWSFPLPLFVPTLVEMQNEGEIEFYFSDDGEEWLIRKVVHEE